MIDRYRPYYARKFYNVPLYKTSDEGLRRLYIKLTVRFSLGGEKWGSHPIRDAIRWVHQEQWWRAHHNLGSFDGRGRYFHYASQ
jgi:hypothetical protein